MKTVVFVTSNEYKFAHAQHMLEPAGISLVRKHMDLQELQSESGEEITKWKAEQAYNELQQPVVVNDDCWVIPGLNGFPGAYMKSMNHWFTPEDWLRLTAPLQDRRIILQQNVVYHDGDQLHYFVHEIEGLLLDEIRGSHTFPHLTIISFDGGKHSGAERAAKGLPAVEVSTETAWDKFAAWLTPAET